MSVTNSREERFNAFKAELDQLCNKHGVRLCVSHYDAMEVWPLRSGDEPVRSNGFENMLDGVSAKPADA